ncbi:hypothetical protein E2C01_092735 [Portunus trituberculatus]|uniref:Uncharacterized protein n=1 Tax=Portunus trituberculatus TaxID=210409 RepID=A0A5B7JH78_PORTR|nr:hypothetical protein [Portunus trituberculatus]
MKSLPTTTCVRVYDEATTKAPMIWETLDDMITNLRPSKSEITKRDVQQTLTCHLTRRQVAKDAGDIHDTGHNLNPFRRQAELLPADHMTQILS